MSDNSGTHIEGRFERATGEFFLANFTDLVRNRAPHVGGENDILQRRVTAEFTEHLEVPSSGSGEPTVRDTMDVDDSGELRPFLISVKRFSLGDWRAINVDVCLRGG